MKFQFPITTISAGGSKIRYSVDWAPMSN